MARSTFLLGSYHAEMGRTTRSAEVRAIFEMAELPSDPQTSSFQLVYSLVQIDKKRGISTVLWKESHQGSSIRCTGNEVQAHAL